MDNIADRGQVPPSRERPAGKLVKELSEQISVLVREELKLAQLEMTSKAKRAGSGAGMMGGGGLIALYGVACLIACAVIALSHVLQAWLSALIVGAFLLLVAAVAAAMGRQRMRQGTPPVPAQAVESVKADVAEVRERARRS